MQVTQTDNVLFVCFGGSNSSKRTTQRSHQIVRSISVLEDVGDLRVYGKTGWTGRDRAIGWVCGWVERGPEVTSSALNMDMKDVADAPKRMAIAKTVLFQLRIL